MEHTDRRFTTEEEGLLKQAKGARLIAMDAVLAAPPDNAWNTVRLHFDGFDININNHLRSIVFDEMGSLEEFGLLPVSEAVPETLDIPEVGADTTVFPVGETVKGVTVVNDIIDVFGGGVPVARVEYPQAIAFAFDSCAIVLDKEEWFSEMIVIKRGGDLEEALYDESVNWEDDPEEDPTTHYEFHTEVQEL